MIGRLWRSAPEGATGAASSPDGPEAASLLAALQGPQSLALLDASSDAVLGVDGSGRVCFANAMAEETFRARRSVLIGRPADDFVPHLAGAVHALRSRRVVGDRRPGPVAEPAHLGAVRDDGRTFPATVWLTPLPLRRGLLVAATVRDLSPQVQADAAEQALRADLAHSDEVLRAVLSAVGDTVLVLVDGQGRITAANPAAERLLGCTAAELLGRPVVELSDPIEVESAARDLRLPPGTDPVLELSRAGLLAQQEWTWLTRTGDRRPVTLRVEPVGDRSRPAEFVYLATERSLGWEPVMAARTGSDRLLLELDDAPTRALRWQVGGGWSRRR